MPENSSSNRIKTARLLLTGVFILSLLASMSLVMGCAAKNNMLKEAEGIKDYAAKVREKQRYVKEMGGPICGLKELAIGESNRAFALYEVDRADYIKVREHLDYSRENVDLAMKKAVACEPPDRDRDGILDDLDECPDDPEDKDGWEDEDGCPDPDNDKDNIPDVEDKCPDDAEDVDEFQDEDGCPDTDNDADGVPDVKDGCPMDPEDKDGWEDDDGCPDPDNDQDGMLDGDDKCPNEAETFNGIEDEDGCPDESDYSFIQVTDKAIEIKQKIYFGTGNARILSKSFPTLNEVALALKEHPAFNVEIGGHTDSRGAEKYNQTLSEQRANSVMQYLIEKGGIDAQRLTAIGYGEARPIDTNRTQSGRGKNRRVEFNITKK